MKLFVTRLASRFAMLFLMWRNRAEVELLFSIYIVSWTRVWEQNSTQNWENFVVYLKWDVQLLNDEALSDENLTVVEAMLLTEWSANWSFDFLKDDILWTSSSGVFVWKLANRGNSSNHFFSQDVNAWLPRTTRDLDFKLKNTAWVKRYQQLYKWFWHVDFRLIQLSDEHQYNEQ